MKTDREDDGFITGEEFCIDLVVFRFALGSIFYHINNSNIYEHFDPVHLAYNPSYSVYFFQPKQYFSLTKNQPTVFFNRLIIPAERGL
jgi:hypothetical protein